MGFYSNHNNIESNHSMVDTSRHLLLVLYHKCIVDYKFSGIILVM